MKLKKVAMACLILFNSATQFGMCKGDGDDKDLITCAVCKRALSAIPSTLVMINAPRGYCPCATLFDCDDARPIHILCVARMLSEGKIQCPVCGRGLRNGIIERMINSLTKDK